LPEPEAAMKEISRILGAGGHYFAVECQSTSSHFQPHDYFRFSPNALEFLAEKHGMELLRAESYAGDFALIGFSIVRVTMKVCTRLGAVGKALLPLACLCINVVFAPLDRLARVKRFKGVFEANSAGHCYVFRKRAP
jgi:hypothetical protein